MKRAFAQRLAFILIALALTSLALGAPPPHAQGEPPPFNENDCVFENGRTTCTLVETSDETQSTDRARAYRTTTKCADGSTLYELRKSVMKGITTTTYVFYGTSHRVESYDSSTEWIEGYIVTGEMCR